MSVLDDLNISGNNAQKIMDAVKEYRDNYIEVYESLIETRKNIQEELNN